MARRIQDSVVRGELDNRERGVVRGRLWLHGETDPVILELKGNASPDLAGCTLVFENSARTTALPKQERLAPTQRGVAGDLTASRKVRVPEVFADESDAFPPERSDAPERVANCLYLEWFSEASGRVVIESPEFKCTVSPPEWRLSPDDEAQRKRDAEAAFAGFLERMTEALERARHEPPEGEAWDEFDYERLMRESDARTDKVMELMDKYRDHPDSEAIIAREMGWDESNPEDESESDDAEPPLAGDEDDAGTKSPDSEDVPELIPEPSTEGVDWVRDEDGDVSHPLALRAFNTASSLWHKCKNLGVLEGDDADVSELIMCVRMVSAKLAGALNSLAFGRDLTEGPFIVARLKRALGHLHAAQAALENTAAKRLLPADLCALVRRQLFEMREEILRLMEEFRRVP